jgi:hypothetical protein
MVVHFLRTTGDLRASNRGLRGMAVINGILQAGVSSTPMPPVTVASTSGRQNAYSTS